MDEYNIFIRINFNNSSIGVKQNMEFTKKHLINKKNDNDKRYLIGGGIYNKNGGTLFFKARNLDEVSKITNGNVLVKDLNMKYDVFMIPSSIEQ